MTNATCGLRGYLSSPSAALQSSLESRLRRQLDGAGSTLFSLIWRQKATPAGRPYFQLAASGRPTSVSDYGSWPTPMAGTPAQKGYNEAGNTDSGRKTVALASWPTPAASEPGGTLEMHNARRQKARDRGINIGATSQGNLSHCAQLASWATPTSRDWKDGGSSLESVPVNALFGRQVLLASGPQPNGSPAQTESPGQLDPDHSRWVMGYETEHLNCAPTETPSSLRRQRSSSVRPLNIHKRPEP